MKTIRKLDKKMMASFECPITHCIMRDPVIASDGYTYERGAIEQWMHQNSTSPMTRQTLTHTNLIPNRQLKDAIEAAIPLGTKTQKDGSSANTQAVTIPDTPQLPNAPPPALPVVQATCVVQKDGKGKLLVSVKPPEGQVRTPSDICCVVDISGSMGAQASIASSTGETESDGLSLLDIVKHAVKTIICTLGPQDRLAIVAYSSNARKVIGLTSMNETGQALAERQLMALHTEGSTNLWDGLRCGLDLLAEGIDNASASQQANSTRRNSAVLLLTDGQPNIVPPRGHLPMLSRYKENNPKMNCTINTFGFGYNLDSALLSQLAAAGQGMYAFIPDSSFVGTSFVHATSNILATMGTSAVVQIELEKGAKSTPRIGEPTDSDGADALQESQDPVLRTDWGVQISVGTLQYGQSREFVLDLTGLERWMDTQKQSHAAQQNMENEITTALGGCGLTPQAATNPPLPPPATEAVKSVHIPSISLKFIPTYANSGASAASDGLVSVATELVHVIHSGEGGATSTDQTNETIFLEAQSLRIATVDTLKAVLRVCEGGSALPRPTSPSPSDALAQAQAMVATLAQSGLASAAASQSEVKALLKDIQGQVTEAVSRNEWFTKWGRHYLPSLARAHELQQCNNFKDPGVQVYGGTLFQKTRDLADDIFCKLPAPTPSLPAASTYGYRGYGGGGGGSHASTARSAPVDMSRYNNRNGPCFHGRSMVTMANGERKPVSEIRKGDLVISPAPPSSSQPATLKNAPTAKPTPTPTPTPADCVSRVRCPSRVSRVVAVVRTLSAGGKNLLVRLPAPPVPRDNNNDDNDDGGLLVTPWHPVVWRASDESRSRSLRGTSLGGVPGGVSGGGASDTEGEWRFPADVAPAPPAEFECDSVYSFVLQAADDTQGGECNHVNHTMRIGGYDVVTLGHGYVGPVIEHPYFGSAQVVQDLKQMQGWDTEEGVITLLPNCMVRRAPGATGPAPAPGSTATSAEVQVGLLCGFRQGCEITSTA